MTPAAAAPSPRKKSSGTLPILVRTLGRAMTINSEPVRIVPTMTSIQLIAGEAKAARSTPTIDSFDAVVSGSTNSNRKTRGGSRPVIANSAPATLAMVDSPAGPSLS